MLLDFDNLSFPSLLYHVRIAPVIAGVAAGDETVALVGGVAVAVGGDVTGSSQCRIVNDIQF